MMNIFYVVQNFAFQELIRSRTHLPQVRNCSQKRKKANIIDICYNNNNKRKTNEKEGSIEVFKNNNNEGTNTRTSVIAISYCVQYYYYSFYSIFSFPLLTTRTSFKREQYHRTTKTTKWIGWNNYILPNNVMTQQK